MLINQDNHNMKVSKLADAIGVVYNATQNLPCYNILEEYYPCADITGCGPSNDPNSLSWDYQSCTEIISNVDTNNVTDMFPPAPFNFTRLIEYCKWRWNVIPDPTHIPETYNYTLSSRIIFSNGLYDPWFPGGVQKSLNSQDVYAIHIPQAAHHLDLRGSDPADPIPVVLAREKEASIINKWLNQFSTKHMD